MSEFCHIYLVTPEHILVKKLANVKTYFSSLNQNAQRT